MSKLTEPEVLFEDQGWVIKGIPGYEDMFDSVYHKCPWKKNWLFKNKYLSTWTMKKLQTCPHCGADIPDSIMAVWKLKNFDLLQKDAEYNKPNRPWPPSFYGGGTFYAGPGQVWTYKPRKKI